MPGNSANSLQLDSTYLWIRNLCSVKLCVWKIQPEYRGNISPVSRGQLTEHAHFSPYASYGQFNHRAWPHLGNAVLGFLAIPIPFSATNSPLFQSLQSPRAPFRRGTRVRVPGNSVLLHGQLRWAVMAQSLVGEEKRRQHRH